MSIFSDTTGFFSGNKNAGDFVIAGYPDSNIDAINIYGVLEVNVTKENTVAVKPLEGSQFTTDSKQIKPTQINLRCVIMPENPSKINNYSDVESFITNVMTKLRNYADGTQLFTLANMWTFGIYQPLVLTGISHVTNIEQTIPVITLSFLQVQGSSANKYSTTDTDTVAQAQAQNEPTQVKVN